MIEHRELSGIDLDLSYEALRKFKKEIKKPEFLPDPAIPITSASQLETIASLSMGHWLETYNPIDFSQLLKKYKDGDESTELLQELKRLRMPGLIMRSIFRYIDVKQGGVPSGFHNFLKFLGKLADSWGTEFASSAIEKIESFQNEAPTSEYKVEIPQIEVSQKKILEDLETILNYLPKESSRMPTESFHKCRILLKHLMNLYQASGFISRDEATIETFSYLSHIVSEMGDIHDEVVQDTLGSPDRYLSSYVTLPASMNHKIRSFILALKEKLETQLGL